MDIFKLREKRTTVGREVTAGAVTFMAMAYIIFVNPKILAAAMGEEFVPALAVATCIGAGVLTILMGLFSNYPFALAPGMGLNAFLAFGVVIGMKVPWQTAMGIVFIEGAIISLLVLTNVREGVMNAIPLDLKRAIGVGIGLLIALIGLQNARAGRGRSGDHDRFRQARPGSPDCRIRPGNDGVPDAEKSQGRLPDRHPAGYGRGHGDGPGPPARFAGGRCGCRLFQDLLSPWTSPAPCASGSWGPCSPS